MSIEEKTVEQLESEKKGQESIEIENRAKMQGWVPKEEFRGDQAKWISADEFVKRADHMMPILKSVNKRLEGQVSELNKKLSQTQDMIGKMVKIQGKYSEDFYTTKISEIKTEKRKAAEAGDWPTYDRLEIEEGKLTKPETVEVSQSSSSENMMNDDNVEVQRWERENRTWYGTDTEMTDYAKFVGDQMVKIKDPLALPGNAYAFCQAIKEKVQKTFPHKFTNPNRNRSDIDESNIRGGELPQTGTKKTWNDLPADAKQQCLKLINNIKGYTKEKYIQDYFEGV